jgi:hypothetical protein
MSAKFEPIRATNLVTEKTEQSPTASGLRLMYFQLSAPPSAEWIQLFDNQRRLPRGKNILGGCELTVEGKYVVMDCVPDELERHHDYLKHDVAVANEDYQKHLNGVEAQTAQEAQKRKTKVEKLKELSSV